MDTEIDPKIIYQKILKPFLRSIRVVFTMEDMYQKLVSLNNIANNLQSNIMLCIFFEKLFTKKIRKSDLILQVILEIKQNLLNLFYMQFDMFKNLHKVRSELGKQTYINKDEFNSQIKKFTNNIVVYTLQVTHLKFFFPYKIYEAQQPPEEADNEDKFIKDLLLYQQSKDFKTQTSLFKQFHLIANNLQSDYLEMQRVENLGTGYYFRDNIDKYITFFNNILEFYESYIFVFKYMSQDRKNKVYQSKVFTNMNIELVFYITELNNRIKENIEDVYDDQLENKFQQFLKILKQVTNLIFIFVNRCFEEKLEDQRSNSIFKVINHATDILPILTQQFQYLHKMTSGQLYNRSIRVRATKFYLYNLKSFPDQIKKVLSKFDVKKLSQINFSEGLNSTVTLYDLYKELQQYLSNMKGFLRKDLKNQKNQQDEQQGEKVKKENDIKEVKRERIYSDAIAHIFEKADQIKDEEEEERENFQVIDQGNMYEDEYDDTLDRLDGQKLERKDSNDRIEIDFGEDEEQEENNINKDPPQNFRKKNPIKTWDDDFQYKSQFEDDQQPQQNSNRGQNKKINYNYKQKDDQKNQYRKVSKDQNNNKQQNNYNNEKHNDNQAQQDDRNNQRGRGNYRGKNQNQRGRGRGWGRGRGNKRGRGSKKQYNNNYTKKDDN